MKFHPWQGEDLCIKSKDFGAASAFCKYDKQITIKETGRIYWGKSDAEIVLAVKKIDRNGNYNKQ